VDPITAAIMISLMVASAEAQRQHNRDKKRDLDLAYQMEQDRQNPLREAADQQFNQTQDQFTLENQQQRINDLTQGYADTYAQFLDTGSDLQNEFSAGNTSGKDQDYFMRVLGDQTRGQANKDLDESQRRAKLSGYNDLGMFNRIDLNRSAGELNKLGSFATNYADIFGQEANAIGARQSSWAPIYGNAAMLVGATNTFGQGGKGPGWGDIFGKGGGGVQNPATIPQPTYNPGAYSPPPPKVR